ncbi:hypothetical protein RND71_040986 [Anisodus tanguticus]|uniref:Uncharacterized protein n=1 Tax=Anisodus tanguticus TaxID=243964 RepID=A0AAE1QT70_9SOLA|nr:hypothetical protein RND71_040986 [Anisodus tanguticus]
MLVPTIQELNMSRVVILRPVESVSDELIDQIKKELFGATTIIRESRAGVVDGSDVGVGDGIDHDIVVDVANQVVVGLVDKRRDDDNKVGGYTLFGGGAKTTDIPYRLGRYSSFGVGTSNVPFCACECNTCK